MLLDRMHPEDVKATLRKRFGSVSKFVEAHGLPETGVSDLFRGRTSRRVREAVEGVLQQEAESMDLDSSPVRRRAHRQNGGLR
jgi:hypothetical protein